MGLERSAALDQRPGQAVSFSPFGLPSAQARPAGARSLEVKRLCAHSGFHGIRSEYDRHGGVLVFRWICEDCGSRLSEAHRMTYTPRYSPHGSDRSTAGRISAEIPTITAAVPS